MSHTTLLLTVIGAALAGWLLLCGITLIGFARWQRLNRDRAQDDETPVLLPAPAVEPPTRVGGAASKA